MRDYTAELKILIPQLVEAQHRVLLAIASQPSWVQEYGEPDDTPPDLGAILGEPCSEADLLALQAHLKMALPPSYRAFLCLHRRWKNLLGDEASLLGPQDHLAPDLSSELQEAVAWKRTLCSDFGDPDPFSAGAVPLVLGAGHAFAVLMPPMRPDGEMDVVDYLDQDEVGRFPDLVAFLRAKLESAVKSGARIGR